MISESTEKDTIMSCERKMAKQIESNGEINKRKRYILNRKEVEAAKGKRCKADADKSPLHVLLYTLLVTYGYYLR